MRRFRRVLALLVVIAPSLPLVAQQADNGDEPSADREVSAPVVYETATVTARPLLEASSSVSVVDRELTRELALTDASEVLTLVPGALSVSSTRGGGGASYLRGGDPNLTLFVLDGVPLNDSTDTLGGSFDLSSFALFGVQKVEVLRGPVSSFYGSAALAGVIHLVTGVEEGSSLFSLDAEVGSFDRWRVAGLLNLTRSDSEWSGFIQGHSENERGRLTDGLPTSERRVPDRFEQDGFSGRAEHRGRFSLATRLRLVSWETADFAEGSGGPLSGTGEVRDSSHDEVLVAVSSEGEGGHLGGTPLRHALNLSVFDHRTERLNPAIPPLVPPGLEDTNFDRLRLFYDLSTTFGGDSRSGLVALGTEWAEERGVNVSTLFLPPFLGGPLAGDYRLERETQAAFLTVEQRSETRIGSLTLEAGLRYDSVDAPSGVAAPAAEPSDDEWSPRVGVAWRPKDGPYVLRGSWGEAFKLPSFYALGSPRTLGGNPALRPESNRGMDIGFEIARPGIQAGLALFRSDYRDLIDFDFSSFQLQNRSAVRTEGVEGWLDLDIGENFELRITGTVQDAEDRGAGMPLLRRPDEYGSLLVGWSRARWHLAARADYRGASFDEQVPTGRGQLPSFATASLAATFQATDRVTLRLRLENLFDRDAESQLGYPLPGRAVRVGLRLALR